MKEKVLVVPHDFCSSGDLCEDAIIVTDEAIFIVTEYGAKYAGSLDDVPPEPLVIRLELPPMVTAGDE